jgi:DnaK suppressor protein
MRQKDIQYYQKLLQVNHRELVQTTRNRDEIQVERASDTIDDVQNAALRDLAVNQLSWDAWRLREIEAALVRIDEGSFGICQHCDEEIHPKRLAALPWAALCVRCQEEEDQRRNGGKHGREERHLALAA